jgi:hypothetical protein
LGGEERWVTEWRDTLLTTAEIAITIAGFAGVVGVLARRDRIGRFSIEYFRLRYMLEYSFFALGYSLLPLAVFSVGFSEPAGWRTSSALAAGAYVAYAIANRRFLSEFGTASRGFERASILIDAGATLLLVANVAAFPFVPGAPAYILAVYLHLFGAAAGFFRLIALVWSSSDSPGGE